MPNLYSCDTVIMYYGLYLGLCGVGNIIYTISTTKKYMVTEILLCGLGSLVSEGHLLFPKARVPRTPRFIYATQDSKG